MLVVKFCGTGDGLEDQIIFCSALPKKMAKCGRYLGQSEAGGLCDGPAQLVPDGLGDIPICASYMKNLISLGLSYFATREWVDLISGKGSDMARLGLAG